VLYLFEPRLDERSGCKREGSPDIPGLSQDSVEVTITDSDR